MAINCPSCASNSPSDAAFCITCGVRLAVASVERGDHTVQPPAASNGFSLRRLLISLVYLICGIAFVAAVLVVTVAVLDTFEQAVFYTTLVVGLFGGAFLAGLRSPGFSVREPVVAIVLVVVIAGLAAGEGARAEFAWALAALVAYVGARFGARLQRSTMSR